MTTTAKKQQQSDIAKQMAEFEKLNGKVKTLAIESRGKNGKPETKAEVQFRKTHETHSRKQKKKGGKQL